MVLELLQREWIELERLAEQDEVSPGVADRSLRDLQVEVAQVGR